MTWRWTPLHESSPPGAVVPGGWAGRMVASDGNRMHLVANAADGSRVGHFSLGAGVVVREPDLPLRRATSAAAVAGRLVVAGVAGGANRPGLCILGPEGSPRPILLDGVGGAAEQVAAWPQVAADEDGERVWAVWATVGSTVSVRSAILLDDHIGVGDLPVVVPSLYDLQVSGVEGGGVVALWDTGVGVGLRQIGRAETGSAFLALGSEPASGAVLADGAVTWPTRGSVVAVLELATGRRRDVDLPSAPEGGSAGVKRVALTRVGDLRFLVWTTQLRPEHAGDTGALTAPSRTWIAALPPDGDPDGATELPIGTTTATSVGDELIVLPNEGAPLAWLGNSA